MSEARFMVCIIPTFMVLSFFFISRILQTGNLQTGPNQFVEYYFVESTLLKKFYILDLFTTNWILQTGFLQTGS